MMRDTDEWIMIWRNEGRRRATGKYEAEWKKMKRNEERCRYLMIAASVHGRIFYILDRCE